MESRIAGGTRRLTIHSARNGAAHFGARHCRRPNRRATAGGRRGVASMIAMLYLVLFSALALGFYATTTMSAQLSRNERGMLEAQLATESGLQFMRFKLSQLTIPHNTSDANVPMEIEKDLATLLEKGENLAPRRLSRSGSTIFIPAIALGPKAQFSASLEWRDSVGRLTVTGMATSGPNPVSRSVRVECRLEERKPDVLGFGVASQGMIDIKRSNATKVVGEPDGDASIMSAHPGSPAIVTGSGPIEGNLSVTGSNDQVSLGGGSVGGSSYRPDIMENHVKVVDPPEFPTVDTTVFRQYATSTYVAGRTHYKNVRIPPNTPVSFSGGEVIEGILYIESPNKVYFSGSAQVNGIIVFENKGTGSQNTLDFRGNVSPDSIPKRDEFNGIREAAQGLSILAPTAAVTMSGSTDANFQGSVIARQVTLAGSADVHFKNGSLVTLGPAPLVVGGKTLSFSGTGMVLPPKVGVNFSGFLRVRPSTYREIH